MPLKSYSPRQTPAQVTDILRRRIAASVHSGRLGPGDSLGSIRGAAREIGCDHRLAAAAYRELAAEGLVEVRPRSGVFIAREAVAPEPITEAGRLFAESLTAGWGRRVSVPALLEFAARQAARGTIRCLLLESVSDAMEEYAEELGVFWGFQVERGTVPEHSGAARTGDGWTDLQLENLSSQHAGVDLVVTTTFHGRLGRAAARALNVPLVVLSGDRCTLPPQIGTGGRCVVLCLDPRYGDRLRAGMAAPGSYDSGVRLIPVGEAVRIDPPDPLERVYMTRAVSQRFPNAIFPIYPAARLLSSRSAADLANALVSIGSHVREQTPHTVPLRAEA